MTDNDNKEFFNYLGNFSSCGTVDNLQSTSNNGVHLPEFNAEELINNINDVNNFPTYATSLSTTPLQRTLESPRMSFLVTNEVLACARNLDQLAARPSSQPYTGPYDFRVEMEISKVKPTKAISWTYSESLNKVFCRANVAVPFRFKFNANLPDGAFIRAIVLPKKDDTHIIQRCPLHISEDQRGNHFMHSTNVNSSYGQCSMMGIFNIRIPAMKYQAGVDYQAESFVFHCFSSCLGINKRDLQILFTLEDGGKVVGRGGVDLKVCACPGRDRTKAEPRKLKRRSSNCKTSSDDTDDLSASTHCKKKPAKQGSENAFFLMFDSKSEMEHSKNILSAVNHGKQKHSLEGQMAPLERTASGGVTDWRAKPTEKVYYEGETPAKKQKQK